MCILDEGTFNTAIDISLKFAPRLILYVSWAKGASIQDLPKIVKNLLNMRLLPSSTGKNLSTCEASMENGPAHLLVIPQAALTSKLQRGKNIEYHAQLTKDDGAEGIYDEFIRLLHEQSREITAALPSSDGVIIQHGTFGNRQALLFESEGPFTHMFEM
ncbi:hypothetical protein Ae201684_000575 [Aphanomyces euteiches]|uniref:D-aminoacyl-tRNA deacylase n=1 Tax=Aphanomyces euteiches TaxID=100861 RepID=A0A6G0XWP0_9STRA|nr:hypothetical protein Ae201684_000575 [Aphanomyces euteiches]KAH9155819.1 hypothetical protein AeRB84_002242 [Aphanomyces euteiches]